MAKSSNEPLKIAGYNVDRISVGKHTLGQIVINNDVTVIFLLRDNGGGSPGGGSGSCLACKISKISQCAALVCPDIKANDPNASCSDAIRECTEFACRARCGSTTGGTGDVIIIA